MGTLIIDLSDELVGLAFPAQPVAVPDTLLRMYGKLTDLRDTLIAVRTANADLTALLEQGVAASAAEMQDTSKMAPERPVQGRKAEKGTQVPLPGMEAFSENPGDC